MFSPELLANPVVFVLLNALCAVVPVPGGGVALNVAAGPQYGAVLGTLLVALGCTCGAFVSAQLARSALRKRLLQFLQKRNQAALLKKVDAEVQKTPFYLIALMRLSPATPFPAASVAIGFTEVDMVLYLVATFVGVVPCAFAYAYSGTAASAAANFQGSTLEWLGTTDGIVALVSALATMLVSVKVGQIAQRALAEPSA